MPAERGTDPRLFLSVDTPEQLAAWEQLKEEGRRLAELALGERLAAGEPIDAVITGHRRRT